MGLAIIVSIVLLDARTGFVAVQHNSQGWLECVMICVT